MDTLDNSLFESKRMIRSLFQVLIIGIIVYACFLFFTDVVSIKGVIQSLDWGNVPYILGLVALGYGLRFYRWQAYLMETDTRIDWRASLRIFFCGIAMAVTPGKAGELIKSYILHRENGVNYSNSIPVVLAERITDLMAILFFICLTVLGSPLIPQSNTLLVFVMLTLIATFGGWPVFIRLLKLLRNYSFVAKYYSKLQPLIDSLDALLRYPFLLKTVGISIASWFAQCSAAYLIFRLLNMPLSLVDVILIISLSTLAGALSMLPAGIGIFEGSMVGVLALANIDNTTAVAATILSRIFMLWTGVIIGSIILQLSMKRLKLTGA